MPDPRWTTALIVLVVFSVSVASPARGLLLAAAAAPLGPLVLQTESVTFGIGEAVVLAFLAGWLLPSDIDGRTLPDRGGPSVSAPVAAWLLVATIAASMARAYFVADNRTALVDGTRLLEGVGLAVATVGLFARRPALAVTLPRALAASASLVALGVLTRHGSAKADTGYYAMSAALAFGMAGRDGGYRRWMWLAATVLSSVAFSVSLSRGASVTTGPASLLSIGGVLGLVIAGLFTVWIGAAVVRSVQALARVPRDARLFGTSAGVMAFLGAAFTDSSMFSGESVYAFWIQFGLMMALSGSQLLSRPAVTATNPDTSSTRGPATRTVQHRQP